MKTLIALSCAVVALFAWAPPSSAIETTSHDGSQIGITETDGNLPPSFEVKEALELAQPKPEMRADSPNTITEPDTAGQTLYALDLIGRLYRISPYSANPDRFLISLGLSYQALAIDPTTLRAFAISSDGSLYEINLGTGGHISQIGHVRLSQPVSMAFNAGGQAYVLVNLDQNLYRLEKTTAALTIVGNTGYYLNGLSFDGDGTLYSTVSVGAGRGSLVRIDPQTGAATVVGNSGGMGGLAIDTDGTLYSAVGSDLYRIDKNTGNATLIGRIGMSGINNLAFLRAPSPGGPSTLPNLTPYQPVDWSDKVVLNNDPSSRTDNLSLRPGLPLFLNWAEINNGALPTGAPFFTDVYVNGILLKRWRTQGALNPNTYNYVAGDFIGAFGAGQYTLRLVVDSTNAISEGSEGDNEYTKDFTIAAPVIRIAGPASGAAFRPLLFQATASGCTPDPTGWIWSSDADLAYGSATAFAHLGWTVQGTHEVRARNSACPQSEGVANVDIQQATGQVFNLSSLAASIDPAHDTVVFCHGLEPRQFKATELWSCVKRGQCSDSNLDYPVGDLLASLGAVNVLQFTWTGAGQVFLDPDATEYIAARGFADEAGRGLAALLLGKLGPNYRKAIQFVGHSLGTAVCGRAAVNFLSRATGVQKAQLTVLDRPDHIGILAMDPVSRLLIYPDFERDYGFNADWLPALIKPVMRQGLDIRLDNYWSSTGAGVGDTTRCLAGAKVYNRLRPIDCPGCRSDGRGLLDPGRVGGRYFPDEKTFGLINNDHSGVQQWYRWTINPNHIAADARGDGDVCHGSTFTSPLLLGDPIFPGALNPCEGGWHASLVNPAADPFPDDASCEPVSISEESIPGCLSAGGASTICQEQGTAIDFPESAAAVRTATVPIDVPVNGRNLLAKLEVSNPSASLSAIVLLDKAPVWSGSLSSFVAHRPTEIGPLSLFGLTGHRQLTLKVFGAGSSTVGLTDLRVQKILVPCAAADALCIAAHRFRVEADWTDHNGNSGHATPRYVSTDESGFMWFFGPANLELIVKVLNGCGVNDNFWVFAGGLTDVGVRLTVTDTVTGAVKIYNNPQGTAFQPIQDTKAFATCSASNVEDGPDGGGAIASVAEPGPPVAHSASLRQGRFDITAIWTTPSGASGIGHFVPVTDEVGYFWFFNPGNIEVVAKVLDGCGLNNRFWVFATGLTDVQVDLTVTDNRSGATRTYHNSLRQSFQPIQDTNALATCP